MTKWMRLMAAGVLAVAGVGVGAAEPYVTIDSFTTSAIDAGLWSDFERKREVVGGQLQLAIRDGGFTTSDTGRRGVGWSDELTRPGPVTQLRAVVRVKEVALTGCAANPSPTRVRARLAGTFFNTGNRVVGSYVGDAFAQVFVYRESNTGDAPGELRVVGNLSICTNADCSSATGIGSADLGKVNVDQSVILQMEWDRVAKLFNFSRDGGGAIGVPYSVSDSSLPGVPFVGVGSRLDIANCASGPRAFGHIDARYDNVWVNAKGRP